MRIVHLQHPFLHGLGYQENYLPAMQRELGHDVHIVTTDVIPPKFLDYQNQGNRFESGVENHDGVPVHRCRSISYDGEAAVYPRGAVKRIRSLDPDIVHSHRMVSFLTPVSIMGNLFRNSDLVFDLHVDNDNFHLDTLYKKFGFAFFKKFVLPIGKSAADGFVAVNPYAKEFLINQLSITPESVHMLPLGVDTRLFFPSQSERNQTRSELGIHDEFTVITAGNLNQSKRIEAIIRGFGEVDNEDMRLIILGDGPDEYISRLNKLTDELGITHQVVFHDFVDHEELSRFYNAADLGVWPGKLGITILEALACGLPVIVNDAKATEFLVSNNNGFTISNVSPANIASGISEYISDEPMREIHGKNAVRLVKNELSWEAIARRSIELYGSL